jgi:prepilin-type N-terminal cleavage/methylation domain-containing protein
MKADSFRARSQTRGFTLIELITVITIVGILAGLLYPTITGIMNRAKRAESSNNLSQIALAYVQYRSDNKGRNLPLRISKIRLQVRTPYSKPPRFITWITSLPGRLFKRRSDLPDLHRPAR